MDSILQAPTNTRYSAILKISDMVACWSEAIEPDDAFGGVAFNQFAYRLEANSNVITLGYNRIMTRSMSIDVSYRFIDSEAAGDVYYERQILRASLLGRF